MTAGSSIPISCDDHPAHHREAGELPELSLRRDRLRRRRVAERRRFAVGARIQGREFIVSFDGWHEHFDTEDDALEWFSMGLSEACRLEVIYRGDTATRWTLQRYENGSWSEVSTTGLLFVPFWRERSVRHVQNRLISAHKFSDWEQA